MRSPDYSAERRERGEAGVRPRWGRCWKSRTTRRYSISPGMVSGLGGLAGSPGWLASGAEEVGSEGLMAGGPRRVHWSSVIVVVVVVAADTAGGLRSDQ